MKVEVLDNVEIFLDDVFVENDEVFKKVFNGDLFVRSRREIFNEDGLICESDDELGLVNFLNIN